MYKCNLYNTTDFFFFFRSLIFKATFKNMYVSPRLTDSLKGEKPADSKVFIWISDRSFFGSVSVIVISVSAFYYNRKPLLIRLREWFSKYVFCLLLVETMASYEKRPRIDIKKFTVCSNVVVKCGTKTVDLIRNYLYEYDEFLFHLLSMNFLWMVH